MCTHNLIGYGIPLSNREEANVCGESILEFSACESYSPLGKKEAFSPAIQVQCHQEFETAERRSL